MNVGSGTQSGAEATRRPQSAQGGKPSNESASAARRAVTIGCFTAVYVVVFFVCGMIGFLGPAFIMVGFFIALIINAGVIQLLIVKSPHFGTLTVVGIVQAIVMTLSGHPWQVLIFAPICFLVGDLLTKAGGYHTRWLNALAFGVLSLWPVSIVGPFFVNQKEYAVEVANSMGQAYADQYVRIFSAGHVAILAAVILVVGTLVGWVGTTLVSKHFAKAGMV